jgi:hypothetical protein
VGWADPLQARDYKRSKKFLWKAGTNPLSRALIPSDLRKLPCKINNLRDTAYFSWLARSSQQQRSNVGRLASHPPAEARRP